MLFCSASQCDCSLPLNPNQQNLEFLSYNPSLKVLYAMADYSLPSEQIQVIVMAHNQMNFRTDRDLVWLWKNKTKKKPFRFFEFAFTLHLVKQTDHFW